VVKAQWWWEDPIKKARPADMILWDLSSWRSSATGNPSATSTDPGKYSGAITNSGWPGWWQSNTWTGVSRNVGRALPKWGIAWRCHCGGAKCSVDCHYNLPFICFYAIVLCAMMNLGFIIAYYCCPAVIKNEVSAMRSVLRFFNSA